MESIDTKVERTHKKGTHKRNVFLFLSGLVVIIFLIATISYFYVPYPPFEGNYATSLKAPSSQHLFGTDVLGRDVFSRILYGAHLTLFMTLVITIINATVGTILGCIAGIYRKKVEIIIMRLTDVMLSFPSIILAIVIAGILGGSIVNTIIAICVVGWAKYARLVRSLALKIGSEDYILASKLSGASNWMIVKRHIIPNILPFVLVTGFSDLGGIMLEIAGLSFLGLGVQSPLPGWGAMLNEGRQYFFLAPWLMFAPGIAILVTVSIFNLWGDSYRDLQDVKSE